MCVGLLYRLQTSSAESGVEKENEVSEDASRYYGSCMSSSLLGGHLQSELVDRLEIQQQSSTYTRYQQQVLSRTSVRAK